MKILIANRGEIARRVIRTARRLGHETVAVFGDPDRTSAHVREADQSYRLGPASLSESYLSQQRLLEAIAETGADAVHPGYGFLAENASFAQAVIDAGALWIGPHPEAVERMGSKIEARRIASAASVPIIPGYDKSQDVKDLEAAASEIGFPVLVKAAAGGGGKGIRIVHEASKFAETLAEAAAESERSFGDREMIVERYITQPRHVEVQIVGDRHGNVVHLGTRECSVQRRYQKVLEEAPAPNLPDATRAGLHEAAVSLAVAMKYDSAGTVEFIVDDQTGEFFFLEMNTRLQVEHTVTEEITGFDIVELMIRSAQGEALPISQEDVSSNGHSFECRINAENPATDFGPVIGKIERLRLGEPSAHSLSRIRWDAAVEEGDEVTPFYDSMIAKLIVWDVDRPSALSFLRTQLDELRVDGLVTTGPFHRWLVDRPEVVAGRVTTRLLDETQIPADPTLAAPFAAAVWNGAQVAQGKQSSLFQSLGALRLTPHTSTLPTIVRSVEGDLHEVEPANFPTDVSTTRHSVDVADRKVVVTLDGFPHHLDVPERSELWAHTGAGNANDGDAITAPFPGLVASIAVTAGQSVAAGDPCLVLEAMKMLHTLSAPLDGIVSEVTVSVGDQVGSKDVLVAFEKGESTQ